MADINTVTDDGVRFRSIVDGAMIDLSPERATRVQNQLGADVIMAFDDCPPSIEATGGAGEPAPGHGAAGPKRGADDPRLTKVLTRDRKRLAGFDHAARLREANERTVRWLERCKAAHQRKGDQALFGIVQGGTDLAQRTWSAERVCAVELPGYAIGGVAVGEGFEDIRRVVAHTAPLLPERKPRYLMGVGYERDLLAAVRAGVDMFDCVLPTRNARNASVFTPTGQLRLRNAQHADDPTPIDPGCDCAACAGGFSRAYLRHLFMVGEMLGPILVSLHNLRHFQRFMGAVREAVAADSAGDSGCWARLVAAFPVAAPAMAPAGEGGAAAG
jgi:queuine tRNA-ribosyltransferase